MTVDDFLLFTFGLIMLGLGVVKFLDFIEKNARNTWWTVAEGTYIESISQRTDFRTSKKLTGNYIQLLPMIWTTIIFSDGTRIKVINLNNLPEPGTAIRIIKNGRADFKIERL